MTQEGLKQLTIALGIFIILALSFTGVRNIFIAKYAINQLFKDYKKLLITFAQMLAVMTVTGIFFCFAFLSSDIAEKIADTKKADYFGQYSYSYLESSPLKSIQTLVDAQPKESQSEIKEGFYYNVTVKTEDKYKPNVTLLAFDDIGLKDGFYVSFPENSKEVNIESVDLKPASNFDKSKLDGLENFKGWSTQNAASNPDLLIVTNINTAKSFVKSANTNIVFSKKKLDTELIAKTLSQDELKNYYSTITSFSKDDYKYLLFDNSNPFSGLMLIAVIVYILFIYVIYKSVKKIYLSQITKYDYLRSSGAKPSIVPKYLVYFFIIPYVIMYLLSILLSYGIIFLLFKTLDLSFIFNTNILSTLSFNYSLLTILYFISNQFVLFFLLIFFIFYSLYRPANKYKYSKISFVRLFLGIAAILFSPVFIFFLKDLPEETKSIIPFVLASSPVASLLGVTIFLRLNNKWRRIVIFISALIYLIGFSVIIIGGFIQSTPSGIILLFVTGLILFTTIFNEFSYKDYLKLLFTGSATAIGVLLIFLSGSGVNFINANQNLSFDLSFQTYSAKDKTIKVKDIVPEKNIISKVSFVRAESITLDDKNNRFISGVYDLASVAQSGLNSKNLSDADKITFYESKDLVILTPEFKSANAKEGDLIELNEILSGVSFKGKVFKVMEDNSNGDIAGKIILPDLETVYTAPRSTLNNIVLLKPSNNTEKESTKSKLAEQNIFDIIDVSQRLENVRQNSASIIQALLVFILSILAVVIALNIPRSTLKGLSFATFSFIFGILISIIYQSGLIIGDKLKYLVSFGLVIVLTYIVIFIYRKIKNGTVNSPTKI